MINMRKGIFTAIVFSFIAFASLQFVTWISHMAFENTCIELQEQYIGTEVREVVDDIENSVGFGKELKNYYGMESLLEQVCRLSEGNLKAAVLDSEKEALYLSFGKSRENLLLLSRIYSMSYQSGLKKVTGEGIAGEKVSLGELDSLVFPIFKNEETLAGYFLVIYDSKSLVGHGDFSSLNRVRWIILAAVSVALFILCMVKKDGKSGQGKKYVRYRPVFLIMTAMLLYILFMFQSYKSQYEHFVSQNARKTAVYIQNAIEGLLDKGLLVERIDEVSAYLNKKAAANAAIESIAIVKNYYRTDRQTGSETPFLYNMEIADGGVQLDIVVNQSYISEKIWMMTLTFGAVFIICLMITFELTHLAQIISIRVSREFNQETKRQLGAVGGQVKLLSFLSYTAIYTSMSYTAVIMRNRDYTLFGCSGSVSASLPLTVELFCITLCSVLVQKVFQDMKLTTILLFAFTFLLLGNGACIVADSPYVLLCLRGFCGIGFGLLKYWLNAIVAAGSEDAAAIGKNFAQCNAGLLGGITVGASLGSILAQSLGYQYNYFFTALLCGVIIVFSLVVMPWKMLDARRRCVAGGKIVNSAKFLDIFRDKSTLKAILLGDIPLNIGLMYVVAFLPVYVNNIGQPTIVTSYAYLINGLAGVYIGVAMLGAFQKLSRRIVSVFALLLCAAGILVLIFNQGIGMILLSAAIMGVFDGYGTPGITGFFTSLPQVKKADVAGMLTVFHSVGSGVQILCPMLYGILIQSDGGTVYLLVFGLCYIFAAAVFLLAFRENKFV